MTSEPNPAVPQLAPARLAARLVENEPICLLDVREPDERAFCRIPAGGGAADLHVPLRTVPDQLDAIRGAAEGRAVVVYCHHGMRSMMAARWLAAQGLSSVENLDGGIDAYSAQVDPGVPRYQ